VIHVESVNEGRYSQHRQHLRKKTGSAGSRGSCGAGRQEGVKKENTPRKYFCPYLLFVNGAISGPAILLTSALISKRIDRLDIKIIGNFRKFVY
jgi:hypothetical protein